MTESRFRDVFNADLANNLGNLARRIETIGAKAGHVPKAAADVDAPEGYHKAMEEYRFHDAIASLWAVATDLNQRIEEVKPWVLQKEERTEELSRFLDETIAGLATIGHWLSPFMPNTAERLRAMFEPGKVIDRGDPLFPRLP